MNYAMSYVSSAPQDLSEEKVQDVLEFSKNWNNDNNITGILLYSEGSFFQVLEGEKNCSRNYLKEFRKTNGIMMLLKSLKNL